MARQWERLDRKANPRGKTTPQVSIQKRGQLMLNAPAFNALGQPTAVELLFDREEQTIGMRQVDPEVPYAYPVKKHKQAASYMVAFATFAHYFGVSLEETRRYGATMEEDTLVIDLREASARSARGAIPSRSKAEETRPQPQFLALADTGD